MCTFEGQVVPTWRVGDAAALPAVRGHKCIVRPSLSHSAGGRCVYTVSSKVGAVYGMYTVSSKVGLRGAVSLLPVLVAKLSKVGTARCSLAKLYGKCSHLPLELYEKYAAPNEILEMRVSIDEVPPRGIKPYGSGSYTAVLGSIYRTA